MRVAALKSTNTDWQHLNAPYEGLGPDELQAEFEWMAGEEAEL
jgi:hypothetical protein